MRILILEDDEHFGSAVVKALQLAGHCVDWIRREAELQTSVRLEAYACILLDLGLPTGSGENCLRHIRDRAPTLPVIVITARGAVSDRIRLLESGADDYIVKPADLDEIRTRVHVVTRRAQMSRVGAATLTHGPLTLDPTTRVATWHGKVVGLGTREFWLLEIFVRQADKVLTRAELEETLYAGGDKISSNAVEVYVHHLRKKITPGLIRTVRGLGYQLSIDAGDV